MSHSSSDTSKPWISSYPPGVDGTIDTAQYRNVLELLEEKTRHWSSDVAFSLSGVSLTFGQLFARAEALASYLVQHAGIQRGDRVAVLLPNLLEFPVSLLGILRAGAVQVSLNPQYTSREVQHQLGDCGARVLIVFSDLVGSAPEFLVRTDVERLLVVGAVQTEPAGGIAYDSFEDALRQGEAAERGPYPEMDRNDLALLQYTGGTTGVAKGAELTHGNVIACVLQMRAMLGGAVEDGKETIVTALPLYHIFALTLNCLTFLTFRARNVLVKNPRDTSTLASIFQTEGITVVTGVNTLFAGLLAMPQLSTVDFSRIKLAVGGGAAVQRSTSHAWYARSGRYILEGWGMSETSCIVSVNSYANPSYGSSVGLPVPSTELIATDEEGRVLSAGEDGELCVKGPQVMRGYWNNPEATAAAFNENGYFKTGDIGSVDEQGFVRICDRKKDMVNVSGFNVYPNEIEEVITQLPGVAECAVVGVPSERSGEAVKAFIVRKDPALTEEAIVTYCRGLLAAYKIPRLIQFMPALPKSAVGKILRRELRSTKAIA